MPRSALKHILPYEHAAVWTRALRNTRHLRGASSTYQADFFGAPGGVTHTQVSARGMSGMRGRQRRMRTREERV